MAVGPARDERCVRSVVAIRRKQPWAERLFGLTTLLTSLLLSLTVAAGEPQPFGLFLRLAGDSVIDAPVSRSLDGERAIEMSRSRLESLQLAHGPYAAELTPALLEAAYEAEEYGNLTSAVDLYRWALHNTRVNNGLYTDDQLPILDRLLALERRRGDPLALRDVLDYRYRVLGQGQPPFTEARVGAAIEWLGIQVAWMAAQPWGRVSEQAADVWMHAETLHDALCGESEWAQPACKDIALRQLSLLYLIDYHIDPLVVEENGGAVSPFISQQLRQQQEWDLSSADRRLMSIERTAAARGTTLIEAALALNPDDPELTLALADWHWFTNRRGAALEGYRTVQTQHPDWLREPEPLPAIQPPVGEVRLVPSKQAVQVSVEVSPQGRANDVDIEHSPEDGLSTIDPSEEDLRRYASRQVRALRFRPAFDADGEPVSRRWQGQVLALKP